MNSTLKAALAGFLNIALLSNQLSAELQQITFDSVEWIPWQPVGENGESGWWLNSGSALVSPEGEGYGGGKALRIPANLQEEASLTRAITWNPSEETAFIDLKVKPAADPEGSLASIFVNGTQLAFQVPEGSSTGEVWVYQGNDGAISPEIQPEEWVKTVGAFPIDASGTAATDYLRITFRHDYARNLWDLFIDGKLAAANLSFEGRGENLQTIEFFGSRVGDTHLDDIAALTENMLFPDADKDGLSDAWEIANGSNPNVYDRDNIKPGTERSFLDLYMDSLWPNGGANGSSGFPSSGGIPPLTIDAEAPHQAVGALKGSMSVGADGSSTYSVPIDLPKGTGGMEPKLSLGYSSNGGNGIIGVGWNLSGLQTITRGPSSAAKDGTFDPMDFDPSDRFFLDGERLVCVSGTYGAPGSEYRTEIDSFARITAIGAGPDSWKVETKAGLIVTLGGTSDSKVTVPAGILSWGVTKVQDTVGNYYSIDYARDPATAEFDYVNQRVSALHYTGNAGQSLAPYCHVVFDYEDRSDISRSYSKYLGSRLSKRLAKIRVLTGSSVNHSYTLSYSNSYQTGRSFLTSVSKWMMDDPAQAVPATMFTYDGLQEGEAIWLDPGESTLPTYSTGIEATGQVNSMVTTEDENTTIRLTGDVARAYVIPTVNIQSDTVIQFDFKSDLLTTGAIIGLDSDTVYQQPTSMPVVETNLYRIGGSGIIRLAPDADWKDPYFRGPTQPYTAGQGWKTFTLDATKFGAGSKGYLVLICADESVADGASEALFRNIRVYNSASQQPADVEPVVFELGAELPRFVGSGGKDLGVLSIDLNSDGFPDLADWRVIDYTNANNILTPTTTGEIYRNTGSGFVRDDLLTPPVVFPLSVRSSSQNAYEFQKKHHLLAQPLDVDGDGILDLMGSLEIRSTPTYDWGGYKGQVLSNEYDFYSLVDGVWTEKSGWELPFYIENTLTSIESGGPARDEHFLWADLNSDAYPDLVVHTTSKGRLIDRLTNELIIGGNAGIAFINKGRNGPGWIRDDSMKLPEPLMVAQKDVGRRLIDLDGDGIQEISEAKNDGTSAVRHTYRMDQTGAYQWNSAPGMANPPASPYDLPTGLVSGTYDSGVLLVDVNGDGLVDVLRGQKLGSVFSRNSWLNQGSRGQNAWVSEVAPATSNDEISTYTLPLPLHYKSDSYRIPYGFEQADINGDGLVDVLYSDVDNSFTVGPDNLAILNTGNGWLQRPTWGLPQDLRIHNSTTERESGKRRAKLQDRDGDGFPDLITNILGGTPKVWHNQCRREVLTSITDGFGSELRLDYRRLNDPTPTEGFGTRVFEKCPDTLPAGHVAIIDSRLVVSRYSEPDGNGGRRYRSQRYGDLRYDRDNESSLGFGWIEAKDELNGQITRTETSRVYPFGGSPIRTETQVLVTAADLSPVFAGVTEGMKCLSVETATYDEMPSETGTDGVVIRRPVQIGSVKTLCDLAENIISRTTTTQNLADFDAYGFVTQSTVESLDGSTVTTSNTYTHTVDAARWHLGRLGQSTVMKSGGGRSTITKTSSFTYDSTTGLLKSETIEPGNALSVTKSYTHDGFGNVTGTSVSGSGLTRSSTSIYDSQGRFVVAESNQLGHTVSHHYDAQRALLLATTDINGKTTSFGYDAFGTLVRTWHPDGTQTGESTGHTDGSHLPPSVTGLLTNPIHFYRAKQSSGSPVAKVYLDALGRELAAETTILRDATASGSARYSKVYTVTQYDTLGRKALVSEPFGAGDTPLTTQIRYDLLSRVVETIHTDGQSDLALEFSTQPLAGQPTTYSKVQNARSGLLERWEDQHGRLIQSRDPSGQITSFHHDHEGRLLSVAIDESTLLTNTFDLFGNKINVWEVNSGASSSIYNAFGEVASSTNAKGQTTSFAYDVLGRSTTITKPEGIYTTSYDARGAGLGKPWKTTGPDGYLETVTYDNFGRPRSTVTTRFGETFTTSTSYDALGRPLTETDAGGLTIVHEYDPGYSFPTALRIGPGSEGAGTLLWQAGTFDSKGRATSQTLAQGVSTSATYHAASGLLATLNASHSGTILQSKTYDWDSMGNLTSRQDAIAARGETFTYDILNRVTGSTVATLPGSTISTVPPPATYNYATNGNLLSKPGLSNVVYDGPRPHAVTSATVKGVSRTYTYDAAGYVTADGRRTYTWTSFGQLKSLDYLSAPALQTFAGLTVYEASRVQCDFDFDAGGNRARQLKQRIAAEDSRQLEETLYLGSYEREVHMTKASASAPPDVTKTVHRHSLGGFAVYTKTEGTTGSVVNLSTILKDHLGSTDLILTGQWNGSAFADHETERQSFNSWGERRAADTFATYRATDSDAFRTSSHDYDRGYTGHEQLDDSGLIHMNGRIYDPELGRMLSPDPVVQVPEYSQNFNRYSYVMNNPLNLTDPTGFSWLSKVFHKVGNWLKKAWKTVVVFVVAVALTYFGVPPNITFAITNALSTALNGGSLSEVVKSGIVGYIQGSIGQIAQDYGPIAKLLATASAAGGANAAMGGKFQDGFISSIKMQSIMGTAKIAGQMLISKFTKQYMTGSRNISIEEDNMLYKAGYDLHHQMDAGTINASELSLPEGWRYVRFFRNYKESNLDYAVFENSTKGIRLMSMVGTQTGGDWMDNFLQGLGLKSPQYMAAIKYSLLEQSEAISLGYSFALNGHSLGGGLAAAAAAVTGAPAAIFNAAGLHPMTLRYAGYPDAISRMGQGVIHYGVGGEVLSGLEFTLFNIIAPKPAASYFYSYAPQIRSFGELSPIEWHRPMISMRSIN